MFNLIISVSIALLLFIFYKYSIKEIYSSLKIFKIKTLVKSQHMINIISLILAIMSLGITLDENIRQNITRLFQDYVVAIITIFLILIILMLNHLNSKNDKIFELKNDLKEETKGLWKEYSDLNKFYKDRDIRNFMQSFVDSRTNVISIQKYKSSIFLGKRGITVNISGDYSYIRPNEDLNIISQGYYEFESDDVQQLLKAYALSNQSIHTKNLKDNNYKYIEDLFFKWTEELYFKKMDEYTDKDALKFQLIQILRELLETGISTRPDLPFDEFQFAQLNRRKSGIEIATFLLRGYLNIQSNKVHFKYKGISDSKKHRLYSNVQVINDLGEKNVFVIAHYSNEKLDEKSKVKQVKTDTEEFISLIQKEYMYIKE
ncbi:hypothetical protein ACQKDD_11715 [Planococcus kocurii]|uniref:hypothetical protein n=1 Tax=Planococcus kocurii TaxID=1374 RepID=UPI003D0784BF